MEYISIKEKKEVLRMLKRRIVTHIEEDGACYEMDDPGDTCDYCPVNNDSIYYCLDHKARMKFENIKHDLLRNNAYSHACKLNFDALRILLGNKTMKLEPRTLCRHDGNSEGWFGKEYLRFIELFKYLKVSNQRNVRI